MAVDRLRYFTGLFLEEPDFTLEQSYHMLMRRRMNYGLLTQGVLFGLTVAREATDRVRVDPGMAVDRDDVGTQAREIMLTAARAVPLGAFTNGSQVYIVASYQEQPSGPKPPQNIEARVSEEPVIQPVLDSGAGFTGDKNVNIILAKVSVGDLSVPNLTERQLSQIRLGGGGGAAGAPAITALAFSIATSQGSNPVMTISGTNLGNTPNVTVLDATSNPDATITAAINAGASSNTSLVVNLMIGAAAPVGPRLVRVQTAGGTVATDSTGFTAFAVIPPAATITTINPTTGRQTVAVPVTINGSNLTGATVSVLLNSGIPDANVTVSGVNVAANGNSLTATFTIGGAAAPGGRIVRITTPGGSADSAANFFTVRPAPVIKSLLPASQGLGGTFKIRGSDIRDPGIAPDSPAVGTVVRFVDPGDPANFVTAATGTVQVDILPLNGPQVVAVVVPARGTVPVLANLTLQIESATAVAPVLFNFPGQ